jgi:hypothetical protein
MSALPDIDLSAIPEDQRDAVAALLRENSDLKGEKTSLQQIVKRLEHLVAELNHVVHGKKSEKLSEDDRQLAFEDLETAVVEVEEQQDSQTSSDDAPRRKSSSAKRNRGNLPENLPRIERVVEPDTLVCPCGCGQMHKIGEDPHGATGHRAGAAACDRDRPSQVCLPRLHRWRHPGTSLWSPDRGRAAHRGRHRSRSRQQVRGPSAVV